MHEGPTENRLGKLGSLYKYYYYYYYYYYTRVRKRALEQRARGMKPRACHRPLRETLWSLISSVRETRTKITLDWGVNLVGLWLWYMFFFVFFTYVTGSASFFADERKSEVSSVY